MVLLHLHRLCMRVLKGPTVCKEVTCIISEIYDHSSQWVKCIKTAEKNECFCNFSFLRRLKVSILGTVESSKLLE